MSAPSTHLIVIVSDAQGERDYTKASAPHLKDGIAASNGAITYSVYAQIRNEEGNYVLRALSDLPENDAQINEMIEAGHDVSYEEIAQSVENRRDAEGNIPKHKIIAAGNGTLRQATELQDAIAETTESLASILNVTHMPNAIDKDFIFDHDVKVATSDSKASMVKKFDMNSNDVDKSIVDNRHIALGAVPHGYTMANCLGQWEKFQADAEQNPEGFPAQVINTINSGKKLYLAVLPAGFDKLDPTDPAKWTPYTEDEAFTTFEAISQTLPQDTVAIIIGGGPRNLHDNSEAKNTREDTMSAAVTGYVTGQRASYGTEPEILTEQFAFGRSYDTTKVFVAIAALFPDSIEKITIAAEANAMRDAVISHLAGKVTNMSMLPSNAVDIRGDYLEQDKADGLPLMRVNAGEISYDYGDGSVAPVKRMDPAKAIAAIILN